MPCLACTAPHWSDVARGLRRLRCAYFSAIAIRVTAPFVTCPGSISIFSRCWAWVIAYDQALSSTSCFGDSPAVLAEHPLVEAPDVVDSGAGDIGIFICNDAIILVAVVLDTRGVDLDGQPGDL